MNEPHEPAIITASAVQTLVLYSLAEHQLGHASTIRVQAIGDSFTVEDDGRGHAIGRTVEGAPYLDFIYCHLDFPYGTGQSKPVQLQGLGMSLLNRLCAELVVTVRRHDATLVQRFVRGRLVGHELIEGRNEVTGNKIAGTVHAAIGAVAFDERPLAKWLQRVQETSPSLRLFFNGQLLGPVAGGA
jgi:DNA gyrase/topoisomerase IV subunit B